MEQTRQPELDGIRALAALAVVFYHVHLPGFSGGTRGVDVFFVLSGWLITGLIWRALDAGTFRLDRFLSRRFLRLAPALYLVVLAHLLLTPMLAAKYAAHAGSDAILSAAYLYDYATLFGPGSASPLGQMWSLAVEMQFYLLWPLVLLATHRLGRTRVALLCGVAWALLTCWRADAFHAGAPASSLYFPLHMHATGLLLGSALALVPLRAPLGWLGLAALVPLVAWLSSPLGIPFAELAAALLLSAPPTWLGAKPLAYLGRVSYGVYLWHYPLWFWLGNPTGVMGALEVLPLSLLLAWLSFRFVEFRFTAPSRPSTHLAPAPPTIQPALQADPSA